MKPSTEIALEKMTKQYFLDGKEFTVGTGYYKYRAPTTEDKEKYLDQGHIEDCYTGRHYCNVEKITESGFHIYIFVFRKLVKVSIKFSDCKLFQQ